MDVDYTVGKQYMNAKVISLSGMFHLLPSVCLSRDFYFCIFFRSLTLCAVCTVADVGAASNVVARSLASCDLCLLLHQTLPSASRSPTAPPPGEQSPPAVTVPDLPLHDTGGNSLDVRRLTLRGEPSVWKEHLKCIRKNT